MINKQHLILLAVAVAAYFVGAKWPIAAQKTGLA